MIPVSFLALIVVGQVNLDTPAPAIESIRHSYLSALTPIFTLDCEMQLEFERVKPDPLEDPAARHDIAHVHLYRKGNWRALYSEFIDGNQEPCVATWRGFDGNLYGNWTKSLRPAETQDWLPGGVLKAEKDNDLYESFTIDRLTGETLTAGDLPLSQLLQDPDAKIVGSKVIAGVNCLEVTFPRHMPGRMYPELKTVETTVWLDPEHSYLPRLIQRRIFYPDSTPTQLHEFETTEFGNFLGVDKQTYTLPITGQNRNSRTRTNLKLVRATINGPLSDQLFKPEFPPLSEVVQSLPGQPSQRVIVGDPRARELAEAAIMERALEQKRRARPSIMIDPPSARPRDARGWLSSPWFQFLIALIVVGAFVSGVRLWRARSC